MADDGKNVALVMPLTRHYQSLKSRPVGLLTSTAVPFSLLASPSPFAKAAQSAKTKKGKGDWDKCGTKKRGTFFVKAYGQASTPMESISYEGTSDESPSYSEAWQERFSPFMSYMGGLQIGYTFPWKGYVSGGLAYQHFQTQFETMQRVVEQITIYDEMAYFYVNDLGETIWVADSVTVTNIYDQTSTHANNHRLIHIPLQVGFLTTQNKFRIGMNVEALLNISKKYEGFFLKEDRSLVEIESDRDAGYMSTSLGLEFFGGGTFGLLAGRPLGSICQSALSI